VFFLSQSYAPQTRRAEARFRGGTALFMPHVWFLPDGPAFFALASGSYRAGVAVIRVSVPPLRNFWKFSSENPGTGAMRLVTLKMATKCWIAPWAFISKPPASFTTGEEVVGENTTSTATAR